MPESVIISPKSATALPPLPKVIATPWSANSASNTCQLTQLRTVSDQAVILVVGYQRDFETKAMGSPWFAVLATPSGSQLASGHIRFDQQVVNLQSARFGDTHSVSAHGPVAEELLTALQRGAQLVAELISTGSDTISVAFDRQGLNDALAQFQFCKGQPIAAAEVGPDTGALEITSIDPAAGATIDANMSLAITVHYQLPANAEATYYLTPQYAADQEGNTIGGSFESDVRVDVTATSGTVTLRVPLSHVLSDPAIARPVTMWIYLHRRTSEHSSVVVAQAGPVRFAN